MKDIELYIPKLEDMWYEQKLHSDSLTMSYNAGYDVSYYGYHYDTGCIDFPKERWELTYNKRIKEKRFFAYIKDIKLNTFVGYVYYHFNKEENRYECGILIESKYREKGYSKIALNMLCQKARKENIKELYDNFEIDRKNTLKLFESIGFEVAEKQKWKKFNNLVEGVIVRIRL